MNKDIKLLSSNWRIVIPNLIEFKDSSLSQQNQLKYLILDRLKHRPQDRRAHIKSQFERGLHYYHIALEHHANGVPHLDILLVYHKSIQRRFTDFNFLYKSAHVSTYKKLNQAILDYGNKEDPSPLSNLPSNSSSLIQLQTFKTDPYLYLYNEMCKDPLHFNVQQYVKINQLSSFISGWSSIKIKLKDMQTAAANLLLKSKPGFKFIDQSLIHSKLSPSQLQTFYSWGGYQTIVNYLNQMIMEKGTRQMKTKNLLITGLPSVGKTSLFSNPNHKSDKTCVQDFCAIYPMGMTHWFPKYQSGVYHMIFWNQAKLTSYSYDLILKFLEGSYIDLPTKGGSSRKVDNPLVVMTSNMTLEQMIKLKFGYDQSLVNMARANLSVRIQNVIVPPKYNLFLLQKLLVSI